MGKLVELPCDIGDTIYVVIATDKDKEVWLDSYIVQDISLKSIRYADFWSSRDQIGSTIFLTKEEAEKVFDSFKKSNEYKGYRFFYGDEEVIE